MKIVLDNGKELVLSDELARQINEEISKAETKKSTGWERVDEYKEYWYVERNDYVYSFTERLDANDDVIYEKANYFASKELAEKVAFRQTLERKLMRFSAEHDGDKIDWASENAKYYIVYDAEENDLDWSSAYEIVRFGQIYFYKKEVAQLAIETFKDDLIKYFTECRM